MGKIGTFSDSDEKNRHKWENCKLENTMKKIILKVLVYHVQTSIVA